MERLGCRRLRTEGRAAAAARATVTQWGGIEGIIVARGCRQRVCLDFCEKECRAVDVAVVGDGAMAAGGLRCFVWGREVPGQQSLSARHEAGIGVGCDLQVPPSLDPGAVGRPIRFYWPVTAARDSIRVV